MGVSDGGLVLGDSPVERVRFRGRDWWVKRDDLLRPFPGNKARKVAGLLQRDWGTISRIVSTGGAQSNAMLALARLARLQGCPFTYYTPRLPGWLRAGPIGNLREALGLGMELVEGGLPEGMADEAGVLFVPQGVAMAEAEVGLHRLAREIEGFAHLSRIRGLSVFLPSGTGTTAFHLQRHLSLPVVTTPCVGDARYLQQQFERQGPPPYPWIIEPARRYRFGEPAPELFAIWEELLVQTGIEFDLLYDPVGWLALLGAGIDGPVLYLHCGGVEGNPSMLARYRRFLG